MNIPLVAIALVGVARIVPESRGNDHGRLDLVGTSLIALGLVALVDAIIEAPTRGWTSALTVGEAVTALVLVWLIRRVRAAFGHPLIDLRVFTSKAFSAAAGAVTIIFFSLFGSLFALTQYLQLVHGYSPFERGDPRRCLSHSPWERCPRCRQSQRSGPDRAS